MMSRLLMPIAFFAPAVLLLIFYLRPDWDPSAPLPLFHFYIVTFTTFAAGVAAVLLSAALGAAARPRHLLAAVSFAVMAVIFFTHGLPTPGALLAHFHPAVQWSAWLTLFGGGLIFLLASLDGAADATPAAPDWLQTGPIVYLTTTAVLIYLLIAAFAPQSLTYIDQQVAPWHRLLAFWLTLIIWLAAASRLWWIWRQTGDRVDGTLALVAFWLGWATISMHQFPLWRLSWWLYHILLLTGFLITFYILIAEYEQARAFQLLRYYVAVSLIATAFLALVGSYLFTYYLLDFLTGAPADTVQLTLAVRAMSLIFSFLTTGLLFLILLTIVWRADKIIASRTAELAEANAELRRLEAIRADLTSMIVHDLRTPLTAIGMGLDLVRRQRKSDDSERQNRLLDNARQATTRMRGMIDDILAVGKLEAGELKLQLAETDMAPFLEARLRNFQLQADEDGKQLTLECEPELRGRLDAELMGRVVENLVDNALKYTGSGGLILVRAWATDGRLWVTSQDNGPGVPDVDKERIFGKYTQLQNQFAPLTRDGAGLGLAFCRLVVEAHGGQISVEDGPQGGSLFKLWLPG